MVLLRDEKSSGKQNAPSPSVEKKGTANVVKLSKDVGFSVAICTPARKETIRCSCQLDKALPYL